MEKLNALRERLVEVHNLRTASALLGWDQQTCMPIGGSETRAAQLGTLSKLAHEMFIGALTGRLLEEAEAEAAGLDYDSDEAALLRVVRHDYDLEARLPTELVVETARVTTLAFEEWQKARAESDYGRFAPWLRRIVDLNRRRAEALGYAQHPYDALLDQFEPGMRTSRVRAILDELKSALVPLVRRVAAQAERVDDAILRRDYDEGRQEEFAREVAANLGYDFTRGRLDRSAHPFTKGWGAATCASPPATSATGFPAPFSARSTKPVTPCTNRASPRVGQHDPGHGNFSRHPREPMPPLGKPGRAQPGFWTFFFPRLQERFPESARRGGRGRLLPRDQPLRLRRSSGSRRTS